jgi:uncharacterized protein YndB with AHSA1/START domain
VKLHAWTLVIAAAITQSPAAQTSSLFAGKSRTGRTIALEVTVDASADDVYRLWTTTEGVSKFFAPASRIGTREGDEYTILFAPAQDPQGLSHGTKGARILRLVPGKEIAFEWITFAGDGTLGVSGPPLAPRDVRDVSPLPTWVEISLKPLDGGNKTAVQFRHYGFKDGALWEQSFAWFSRTWATVLENLKRHCERAG